MYTHSLIYSHTPRTHPRTPTQLADYLVALQRIRKALTFFQTHDPQDEDLKELTRLRNKGLQALDTLFMEVCVVCGRGVFL